MILRIAGVAHFDPTGRQRLVEWLRHCSGKPTFIATEWDKHILQEVLLQREEFRRLISNQWPTLSADLLKSLTLFLAYEGDTHLEVFPEAEILWLDEGREPPEELRNYARNRFEMYKAWLGDKIAETDDSAILRRMSEMAAAEAGDPPIQGNERDAKFADLILRRVTNGGDWAAIIVGKFHALNYARSMRELLEAHDQICEVALL